LSQVHSGFWMFVRSLQKPLCFGRINPNRVSTETTNPGTHHQGLSATEISSVEPFAELRKTSSFMCYTAALVTVMTHHAICIRMCPLGYCTMREEACEACHAIRIATGLAGAGKIDGNCCMFILFLCHCSSAQRRGNKLLRIQRLAPGKGSTWPRRTATWNNKIKRIKLTLIRCQPIQSTWTNVLCPPCPDCMTG